MDIVLLSAAIICIISLIVCCFRCKRPLRVFIVNLVLGVLLLAALSVTEIFTGVGIPVNMWTVSCAAVGGLPGIILMLAVKVIWLI